MDFKVIKRAGITQEEFSRLVGVSRVTANNWVRGKMRPHRFVRVKIAQVLGYIQDAIEAGELPLRFRGDGRLDAIKTAIKNAVQRAKAA